MEIFKVNSVDYSSYVYQKSWKVQNVKEYASWVDGNRITRRTVTRQKVSGSFVLTFLSSTDFDTFKTTLAAATVNDDYTAITLYVDNEHQLMNINAFITLNVKTLWTQDSNQTPSIMEVTVRLEQR